MSLIGSRNRMMGRSPRSLVGLSRSEAPETERYTQSAAPPGASAATRHFMGRPQVRTREVPGTGGPYRRVLDQMVGAATSDFDRLTEAEQQRFEGASRGLDRAERRFESLPDDVRRTADRAGTYLQESGYGKRTNEFMDRAMEFTEGSIATMQQSRDDYQDYSSALTQDAVRSEMAAIQDELTMIESGLNPDGTMMTPAQRQAARRQAMEGVRQRSASAMVQIAENSQRQMLQLDQGIAQMQQAGASTAADLAQIGSSLAQFDANLRSAAELRALEARAAGDLELAAMRMQHSRSPVSMMASLVALAQAAQAGTGNLTAFNFEGVV